jgi:FixJ family two-component response regulator
MNLAYASRNHQQRPPVVRELIPTVFVVDEEPSIRESLEHTICDEEWQCETYRSIGELFADPRPFAPNCLLVALSALGPNPAELQRKIAQERAEMAIIIISDSDDIPTTVKAIKAGAFDFLVKPISNDGLRSAVRQGMAQSRSVLEREADRRCLCDRYASLSVRERQVMALIVSGLLNKQVGGELGISEITVKAHRGRVMQKMQANSFADLVRMGGKLGSGFAVNSHGMASAPVS